MLDLNKIDFFPPKAHSWGFSLEKGTAFGGSYSCWVSVTDHGMFWHRWWGQWSPVTVESQQSHGCSGCSLCQVSAMWRSHSTGGLQGTRLTLGHSFPTVPREASSTWLRGQGHPISQGFSGNSPGAASGLGEEGWKEKRPEVRKMRPSELRV